jgi:hypothetical protein
VDACGWALGLAVAELNRVEKNAHKEVGVEPSGKCVDYFGLG